MSYRTLRERVERFARALDAPSSAVWTGRNRRVVRLCGSERPRARRSRVALAWAVHARSGLFEQDKAPIFTIVDRGSDQGYVMPAKSTDESTVRLLLDDHEEESLTVYTDGFRAYEPLEDDDNYNREYVVHGDGEYVDGDVHVNGCESHASLARRWLSPHR